MDVQDYTHGAYAALRRARAKLAAKLAATIKQKAPTKQTAPTKQKSPIKEKAPTKENPKDADRQARLKDAIKAYSQNPPIVEKRFPVVVKPDTSISSAESLKQVLKLETLPRLVKTKTASLSSADSFENSEGEETLISVLNFAEIKHIRDTLEVEEVVVWFPEQEGVEEGAKKRYVKRFAIVAVALMPKSEKATQNSADTSVERKPKL
jgi:hypothetical protein